jgi:hypothetical protein
MIIYPPPAALKEMDDCLNSAYYYAGKAMHTGDQLSGMRDLTESLMWSMRGFAAGIKALHEIEQRAAARMKDKA